MPLQKPSRIAGAGGRPRLFAGEGETAKFDQLKLAATVAVAAMPRNTDRRADYGGEHLFFKAANFFGTVCGRDRVIRTAVFLQPRALGVRAHVEAGRLHPLAKFFQPFLRSAAAHPDRQIAGETATHAIDDLFANRMRVDPHDFLPKQFGKPRRVVAELIPAAGGEPVKVRRAAAAANLGVLLDVFPVDQPRKTMAYRRRSHTSDVTKGLNRRLRQPRQLAQKLAIIVGNGHPPSLEMPVLSDRGCCQNRPQRSAVEIPSQAKPADFAGWISPR